MRRTLIVCTLVVVPAVVSTQIMSGSRWQPRPRDVPSMPLDTDVSSGRQPIFKTGVTRVEVSALVVDAQGRPMRGLRAEDFQIFEDGRPQTIASFVPFDYHAGVLPMDRAGAETLGLGSVTPVTNAWSSTSRLFALLIDDLHIDARRTERTRQIARRLVEQLAPSDLLFVGVTSSTLSTSAFTRDRRRALQIINSASGQRLLDPTIEMMRTPGALSSGIAGGYNTPGLAASEQQRSMQLEDAYGAITRIASAVRGLSGRRKSLLFLSEGSPVGASATSMGRTGGSPNRALQEAMATATVADLVVYPLNPAGLDTIGDRLIEGQMRQADSETGRPVAHEDQVALASQSLQGRTQLRDMAVLTGGVSLIDSNDLEAGIDRVIRDASSYYVLSYEPDREVKDNTLRSIEVKVSVAGARVHARRGYMAPRASVLALGKTPPGLSPALQVMLGGVVPEDGLPMLVQVAPIAQRKGKTLMAIVTEVVGVPLADAAVDGRLSLEQAVFSIDDKGKTSNATRKRVQMQMRPEQLARLRASGLRTVWGVELPPGRHQLRMATVDESSGRGGSFFLDVEVRPAPGAPGLVVSSQAFSAMPTAFVDKDIEQLLPRTPTASRLFPGDDTLQLTVSGLTEAAPVRILSGEAVVAWEGRLVPGDALSRLEIPLGGMPAGDHRLVVGEGTCVPAMSFSVLPREAPSPAQPDSSKPR